MTYIGNSPEQAELKRLADAAESSAKDATDAAQTAKDSALAAARSAQWTMIATAVSAIGIVLSTATSLGWLNGTKQVETDKKAIANIDTTTSTQPVIPASQASAQAPQASTPASQSASNSTPINYFALLGGDTTEWVKYPWYPCVQEIYDHINSCYTKCEKVTVNLSELSHSTTNYGIEYTLKATGTDAQGRKFRTGHLCHISKSKELISLKPFSF